MIKKLYFAKIVAVHEKSLRKEFFEKSINIQEEIGRRYLQYAYHKDKKRTIDMINAILQVMREERETTLPLLRKGLKKK